MAGNPKTSKWRSTPNEARARKEIKLTLSGKAHEKLKWLTGPGGSRSAVVEKLIEKEKAHEYEVHQSQRDPPSDETD